MLSRGPAEWLGLREALTRLGKSETAGVVVRVFTDSFRFAADWWSSWQQSGDSSASSVSEERRWLREMASFQRQPHRFRLRVILLPNSPLATKAQKEKMTEVQQIAMDLNDP